MTADTNPQKIIPLKPTQGTELSMGDTDDVAIQSSEVQIVLAIVFKNLPQDNEFTAEIMTDYLFECYLEILNNQRLSREVRVSAFQIITDLCRHMCGNNNDFIFEVHALLNNKVKKYTSETLEIQRKMIRILRDEFYR